MRNLFWQNQINRHMQVAVAILLSILLVLPYALIVRVASASSQFEDFEGSISKEDFVHHGGPANYIHTNSANEAYEGKRALKIVSTSSNSKTRKLDELTRWITPIEKHSVVAGQKVRVDVYMKSKGLKEKATVAISFFDEKGDGTWGDAWVKTATSAKQLTGDTEWTKVSLATVAPADAQYVRPEFRLWDSGTIWIDNYTLTITDPASDGGATSPEDEAQPGPVVTPPDSRDEGGSDDDGAENEAPEDDAKEGEIFGAIPYEGPNQYDWSVIPEDPVVRTTLHGINRAAGQQLFTVDCLHSHYESDDPIVFPNDAGASHSHEFFGDTSLNASSTTQDILENEGNTCQVGADRSAYWVPAAYQDGKLVEADNNKFYYKVGKVDPTTIQPMPVGLRMIAGNANATGPQSRQINYYFATTSEKKVTEPKTQVNSGPNLFTTRADENGLRIQIQFPQCWDGENLWLPKTAHMAYPTNGKCPSSHPVPLLQLMFNLGYTDATGGEGFKLSSGEWYTAHADFINGWHPETLEKLTDVCLRGKRYCGITRSDAGGCQTLAGVRTNRSGCIEISPNQDNPRFYGKKY